jgi:hypothetical protein
MGGFLVCLGSRLLGLMVSLGNRDSQRLGCDQVQGNVLTSWNWPGKHMGEIRAICDPYHWTIRRGSMLCQQNLPDSGLWRLFPTQEFHAYICHCELRELLPPSFSQPAVSLAVDGRPLRSVHTLILFPPTLPTSQHGQRYI